MAEHIKTNLCRYIVGGLISFTLIGVKVQFEATVAAQLKPIHDELQNMRQQLEKFNERIIRIETQHEIEKKLSGSWK